MTVQDSMKYFGSWPNWGINTTELIFIKLYPTNFRSWFNSIIFANAEFLCESLGKSEHYFKAQRRLRYLLSQKAWLQTAKTKLNMTEI